MTAQNTKRSLPSRKATGLQPPHSDPGAALPCSTPTVKRLLTEGTDQQKALVAAFLGLMSETLSGDAVYLGMMQGRTIALAAGVSPEAWDEICIEVAEIFTRRKKIHPLGSMF